MATVYNISGHLLGLPRDDAGLRVVEPGASCEVDDGEVEGLTVSGSSPLWSVTAPGSASADTQAPPPVDKDTTPGLAAEEEPPASPAP